MPDNDLDAALASLADFAKSQQANRTQEVTTAGREKETRGDRLTNVINARNQTPFDFLQQSLEGNAQALPGIIQLANILGGSVGNRTLEATGAGTDFFSGITKDSASSAGVDIEQLTSALTGIGAANLREGQNIVNDGNALISGQFFDTAVGQQSLENLFRQLGPTLSPAGLDATQNTFGGSTSNQEVDQITAFLRNSLQERDRGFALRNQGIAARDSAASRLGGVLTFGTQFGQQAASQGLTFGQGVGNLESQLIGNQLITPGAVGQDNAQNLQSLTDRLNNKENQKLGQDAQSAANAAGVGSAIGQIAGIALAPFTGGASLALTAAASGAGAAAGGTS